MRVVFLVSLLLGVFLSSAQATTVDSRTVVTYPPLSHERGRVVLLHGFTGTHLFYRQRPASSLLYQLRKAGYRAIIPDLPYSGPSQGAKVRNRLSQDGDGGVSYLKTWHRTFKKILAVDDRRHEGERTIVGGISWGGWHAMQAACGDSRVQGWFAISPVTQPALLTELSGLTLPAMNLDQCARRLGSIGGALTWGDADTRVGIDASKHWASMIGAYKPVQVTRYAGLDHTTTPAAIYQIVTWVKNHG